MLEEQTMIQYCFLAKAFCCEEKQLQSARLVLTLKPDELVEEII